MKTITIGHQGLLLLALNAFWMTSCQQPGDVAPAATTPTSSTSTTAASTANADINHWILANMRYAYFWADKIPAAPDTTLDPVKFFDSILYKYSPGVRPDGDRFSWIDPDASHLQASLGGQNVSTGADYRLYLRSQGATNVIGVILYVDHGSPAEQAGLTRGDIFYAINGQNLTTTNYSALTAAPSQTFSLAALQNGALVNTSQTKTATAISWQTDPVYLDSVYTVNGKTIGYLVYNEFIGGPYNSSVSTFNQKLDTVFGRFKAQGVNELVLDLRYNPGGGGDVATNLASYIAPGASPTNIFFTQAFNPALTAAYQKQYGAAFNTNNFSSKAANLNLSRVFILTTKHTASASELVINGLKPYMSVVVVGDTTYGKNVGSTTIIDKTGVIKYGLQPIITKAFNAAGQSDYTGGFVPDALVQERLPYKALGDLSEPLLSQAVLMLAGSRPARLSAPSGLLLPEVGSSVAKRAGGSSLTISLAKSRL